VQKLQQKQRPFSLSQIILVIAHASALKPSSIMQVQIILSLYILEMSRQYFQVSSSERECPSLSWDISNL
jgi:hypothetical protein